MFSGCGSKGGADDEEDDTSNSQRSGGDLPAIEKESLGGQVIFQEDDLLFGFIERIRTFGEP